MLIFFQSRQMSADSVAAAVAGLAGGRLPPAALYRHVAALQRGDRAGRGDQGGGALHRVQARGVEGPIFGPI